MPARLLGAPVVISPFSEPNTADAAHILCPPRRCGEMPQSPSYLMLDHATPSDILSRRSKLSLFLTTSFSRQPEKPEPEHPSVKEDAPAGSNTDLTQVSKNTGDENDEVHDPDADAVFTDDPKPKGQELRRQKNIDSQPAPATVERKHPNQILTRSKAVEDFTEALTHVDKARLKKVHDEDQKYVRQIGNTFIVGVGNDIAGQAAPVLGETAVAVVGEVLANITPGFGLFLSSKSYKNARANTEFWEKAEKQLKENPLATKNAVSLVQCKLQLAKDAEKIEYISVGVNGVSTAASVTGVGAPAAAVVSGVNTMNAIRKRHQFKARDKECDLNYEALSSFLNPTQLEGLDDLNRLMHAADELADTPSS